MTDQKNISTKAPQNPAKGLDKYFRAAVTNRASDLHLKVGRPPKLRVRGQLRDTSGEPMTEQNIEQLVFEILSEPQKESFLKNGTLDFAYELDDENRFRINIFRTRGTVSLAARRVESFVPTLEQLHLPDVLEKIADRAQGLVLVVGPTGAGKTTTIASMIDFINRTRPCHIISIEDPIEYVFKDKKAMVSQREVGLDVKDFGQALDFFMRQDPDVVFIGEMRDSATVAAGMRAAETGHLVFGTLHSANAPQAVGRILDLFSSEEREMIRKTLSITIKAVVSQLLLPSTKEGVDRIPALEIMLANPEVKKLIAEGRQNELPQVIKACREEGMLDINDSLCQLIKAEYVDPKVAFKYASNPDELKMALKGIRAETGGIL